MVQLSRIIEPGAFKILIFVTLSCYYAIWTYGWFPAIIQRALCDILRIDKEMQEKRFAIKEYLRRKKSTETYRIYQSASCTEKPGNIWRYCRNSYFKPTESTGKKQINNGYGYFHMKLQFFHRRCKESD